MFTDICAAIEEARFLRAMTGHSHAVIQRPGGIMHVRKGRCRGMHTMYSTKQDRFATVITDEVKA